MDGDSNSIDSNILLKIDINNKAFSYNKRNFFIRE